MLKLNDLTKDAILTLGKAHFLKVKSQILGTISIEAKIEKLELAALETTCFSVSLKLYWNEAQLAAGVVVTNDKSTFNLWQ